jgi:hypothetical protein
MANELQINITVSLLRPQNSNGGYNIEYLTSREKNFEVFFCDVSDQGLNNNFKEMVLHAVFILQASQKMKENAKDLYLECLFHR